MSLLEKIGTIDVEHDFGAASGGALDFAAPADVDQALPHVAKSTSAFAGGAGLEAPAVVFNRNTETRWIDIQANMHLARS